MLEFYFNSPEDDSTLKHAIKGHLTSSSVFEEDSPAYVAFHHQRPNYVFDLVRVADKKTDENFCLTIGHNGISDEQRQKLRTDIEGLLHTIMYEANVRVVDKREEKRKIA